MANRIITFTTDFGVTDHFVGTMKGVILKLNPSAQIVDISNNVHSYDILDGALTIAQAYQYYPSDTVHMVIVDPGVGTHRRPLLVTTEKHIFLAPDNGVLSLVFEREERLSVRHVSAEHYFLQPVSQTFHGRDVFAAVAGWLSKGVDVAKFGEEITDFTRFGAPKPKLVNPALLKGVVLKMDKFGNLITNFTVKDLPQLFAQNPPAFKFVVGNKEVITLRTSYAQGMHNEVFAIVGSTGFLELATNRGSAAALLGANRGTEVGFVMDDAAVAAVAAATAGQVPG
ncbi:MAG: SAM-dependent chlorinase/fluorinase [Acidobacteriales bacterium]|nr:SAM-dependent chlorinase/fluorinase [Terriglobales bacterium]